MASKSNTLQKGDQTARVHGGQSNRRTKDRGDSRTVFKSVLANPFEVKWPVVSLDVQNAILARVVELMQGVAEYNLNRHKQSRTTRVERRLQKRAKASKQNTQNQQAIVAAAIEQSKRDRLNNNNSEPLPESAPTPEPEILQHTLIGINAVTKRLEAQCRMPRQIIPAAETDPDPSSHAPDAGGSAAFRSDTKGAAASADGLFRDAVGDEANAEMIDDTDTAGRMSAPSVASVSSPPPSASPVKVGINATRASIHTVLVCRADIDPPLLVAHVPHLVAACNSATKDPIARIRLVPLPKGAESSLAASTGLRHVSVLGFDEVLTNDPTLSSLLSSVPTIMAPWLVGVLNIPEPPRSAPNTKTDPPKQKQVLRRGLEPTHIKQLGTTAPKDMRAAKALRSKGRAEAKAQRKAKEAAKKTAKERHSSQRKKSGGVRTYYSLSPSHPDQTASEA